MPTRVLVLRHGQSTWNAERRWQGQEDPPLSPLGERQALAAASQLGMFDLVVASDLDRARRTAELIASELGIGPVSLDDRLRETYAASWQGLTRAEIDDRWPGWIDAGRRPEGFEEIAMVQVRALAALLAAARLAPGGEILAVSHGGVIRALRQLDGFPEVPIPNLGGGWFTIGDGPRPDVRAGELVELVEGGATTGVNLDLDPGRL